MLGRRLVHFRPVNRSGAGQRLQPEKDILGDRKVGGDAQFLVHHADTGRAGIARRTEMDWHTIEQHPALEGGIDAGDDFHQGALAGPVLADEPVNFAGPQHEIDIPKGLDAAKRLRDAVEFQQDGRILHQKA